MREAPQVRHLPFGARTAGAGRGAAPGRRQPANIDVVGGTRFCPFILAPRTAAAAICAPDTRVKSPGRPMPTPGGTSGRLVGSNAQCDTIESTTRGLLASRAPGVLAATSGRSHGCRRVIKLENGSCITYIQLLRRKDEIRGC